MNKKELIKSVSNLAQLNESQVEKVFNSLSSLILSELKKEEKINFLGLGNFEVAHRKERTGIIPATKEKIVIPAKKVVKFKATKALKELF